MAMDDLRGRWRRWWWCCFAREQNHYDIRFITAFIEWWIAHKKHRFPRFIAALCQLLSLLRLSIICFAILYITSVFLSLSLYGLRDSGIWLVALSYLRLGLCVCGCVCSEHQYIILHIRALDIRGTYHTAHSHTPTECTDTFVSYKYTQKAYHMNSSFLSVFTDEPHKTLRKKCICNKTNAYSISEGQLYIQL